MVSEDNRRVLQARGATRPTSSCAFRRPFKLGCAENRIYIGVEPASVFIFYFAAVMRISPCEIAETKRFDPDYLRAGGSGSTVNFSGEPEPKYKGKRLSEWAEIYETSFEPDQVDGETPKDSEPRREAVEAAHQTRDKLLPVALKMIRYEKPKWFDPVERRMEQMDVRRWCPVGIWGPFYGDRGEDNMVYFRMLGADASPAVPELVRIMKEAEGIRIRERAMYALAYIGKDGLPPLLEVLGDPNNADHRRAAFAITCLKDQGAVLKPAVPLLVKRLEDPDDNVRYSATNVLMNIAPEVLIGEGQ